MKTNRFFEFFALPYDLLTSQVFWDREIEKAVLKLGELSCTRQILDVGCGPGASAFVVARSAPNAMIVAVDYASAMVERARRNHRDRHPGLGNLSFECADAMDLPFPDHSFDAVIGHSFLYLVEDRQRVLSELMRVLRPGGVVIFLEPNRSGNLAKAAVRNLGRGARGVGRPVALARFVMSMILWRIMSHRYRPFTAGNARELFEGVGFEQVECEPTLSELGLHCAARRAACDQGTPEIASEIASADHNS